MAKTSVPGEFKCHPLVYHSNKIKALNQDENHSSSHLHINLKPCALFLTMSSFTTTAPAVAQAAFSQSPVEVCLQHRAWSPSRGTAEAGAPLICFVFLCLSHLCQPPGPRWRKHCQISLINESPSKAGGACRQSLCLPMATDVAPLFRFVK